MLQIIFLLKSNEKFVVMIEKSELHDIHGLHLHRHPRGSQPPLARTGTADRWVDT